MKKAVAVVFDVVVVVVVVVGWPAPVFHVRAVPPKMEKKKWKLQRKAKRD